MNGHPRLHRCFSASCLHSHIIQGLENGAAYAGLDPPTSADSHSDAPTAVSAGQLDLDDSLLETLVPDGSKLRIQEHTRHPPFSEIHLCRMSLYYLGIKHKVGLA